jgi:hypothetical protein
VLIGIQQRLMPNVQCLIIYMMHRAQVVSVQDFHVDLCVVSHTIVLNGGVEVAHALLIMNSSTLRQQLAVDQVMDQHHVNLYVVRRGNQCSRVLIGTQPMANVLGLILYLLNRTQLVIVQGRYVGFYVAVRIYVQTGRMVVAHALLAIHSSLLLHHLSVAVARLHVNLRAVTSGQLVLTGTLLMECVITTLCSTQPTPRVSVLEIRARRSAVSHIIVLIGRVEVVHALLIMNSSILR